MNSADLERLFPDLRMQGNTELERGHLVLARMFRVFAYLCELHHIQWWAAGGTMLGALRGGEILPWSGDIDICMTPDSLLRFWRECVPLLPQSMFFQSAHTDPFFRSTHTCNLRDRYSNYYEWAEWNPSCRHHNGLQLDLFIESEGLSTWPSLGPWKPENTFPLVKGRFLGMDCYLEKEYQRSCEILYGKEYMTIEKQNHSGRWHATRACDHPASLEWVDEGTSANTGA